MATDMTGPNSTHHRVAGIVVQTDLGWVAATARAGALAAACVPAPTKDEAVAACGIEADWTAGDRLLEALADDLRRYFRGERVELDDYRVDLSGLPRFHRRALLAAKRIPHGQVRSYLWVAARAGNPRGARAAGQAMAHNPIPLVIPCHRVVGADGSLTGFGSGLGVKRALLELEGVPFRGERVVLPRRAHGSHRP